MSIDVNDITVTNLVFANGLIFKTRSSDEDLIVKHKNNNTFQKIVNRNFIKHTRILDKVQLNNSVLNAYDFFSKRLRL